MKPKFMPFIRFDQSLIGKETLYIFPLPHGPRCLIFTNGTELSVISEEYGDITGFSPDVEDAIKTTYLRMYSEPNQKYTVNGVQVVFPYQVFDVILHDRVNNVLDDGTASETIDALEGDWDLIGAPAETGKVRATVLASLLKDEYTAGRSKSDLWWNRAWHKRAMIATGFGNQKDYPKSEIGWLEIASRFKDSERSGIAVDTIDESWDYIFNMFHRRNRGVLIADVWAGWNVNGGAFRIMTEEDIEV